MASVQETQDTSKLKEGTFAKERPALEEPTRAGEALKEKHQQEAMGHNGDGTEKLPEGEGEEGIHTWPHFPPILQSPDEMGSFPWPPSWAGTGVAHFTQPHRWPLFVRGST